MQDTSMMACDETKSNDSLDDMPRSLGRDKDTYVVDSYDSLCRSDTTMARGAVVVARNMKLDKPHSVGSTLPYGSGYFQGGCQVSMAPTKPTPTKPQVRTQLRTASLRVRSCDHHQSSDESNDDMGMMEETDSDASGSDGFPPLPVYYQRNTTYVCTVSSIDMAENIGQGLTLMAAGTAQDRYTEFRRSETERGQFDGRFFERSRSCTFVINTYSGDQTSMEIRSLDGGLDARQTFSIFVSTLVSILTKWGVLQGLVDSCYLPLAPLQWSSSEEETMSEEEDSDGPSMDEIQIVVSERVGVLRRAVYAKNQRALSSELLSITVNYPEAVANDPDVPDVLVGLLKGNARSDIQMSMALLRVVRKLSEFKVFLHRLRNKKLSRVLLQTALDVSSKIWQNDLVRTVMALETAPGLGCKSKRLRETYNRIKARI